MKFVQGEVYFDRAHVEALQIEPGYVRARYQAVVRTLAPEPLRIIREKAADMIGIGKRQMQRIVKRYKAEGIPGLRFRSKKPNNSPNRTSKHIEEKVIEVRKASGFGPCDVAVLVNESFRREGRDVKVWPSTVYNILCRDGEIERERRIQNEWKRFEWGHPNRLIQADLTRFNGVPILTMEDDHARKG